MWVLFVFLCKLYVLEIVVHILKKLSKEEKYLDKMSYFNSFAKGKKQSCQWSFDLGEVPGYQPQRDFNADIVDTLGKGSIGGRGISKQWEEYYHQPGKRAESGSSTEAYATDERKRETHQLWLFSLHLLHMLQYILPIVYRYLYPLWILFPECPIYQHWKSLWLSIHHHIPPYFNPNFPSFFIKFPICKQLFHFKGVAIWQYLLSE